LAHQYGARKNAMFHGPTFLRRIEAHTAPSRWIELDCGHWLALAEPRRCIAEINAFCANRESGSQTQPSKKKR
jgi:hypothetical protein